MKRMNIFGIALIIVGAIMLLFSNYIAEQVAAGKLRISSAQGQVDTANTLFSQSQYTKPIGGLFTGGAQNRINAGNVQVSEYAALAHMLQIGGVILILVGIGVLFLGRKR